MTDPFLPG